jgi:uncharacterized protein (DUF433 family)
MNKELLERITSNSGIFNGKPIIRNMRFTVADVLGYLAAGITTQELLTDFPFLEADDIKASLIYASQKVDHPIIKINLNAA